MEKEKLQSDGSRGGKDEIKCPIFYEKRKYVRVID